MFTHKHIDDILYEDKYTAVTLSFDTRNTYANEVRSRDKKYNKNAYKKRLRFSAYSIYRLKNVKQHYNYSSFIKILYCLFQEITYQIIYKRRSWIIRSIGVISATHSDNTERKFPNGDVYKGKFNRSMFYVIFNKNTNIFIKRFRITIADNIKAFYKKDYINYNNIFTHKRAKTLKSIR